MHIYIFIYIYVYISRSKGFGKDEIIDEGEGEEYVYGDTGLYIWVYVCVYM
jgi:hypothetical protein